ncbi:hypothetical protein TNCV_364341 [Trichonephila clavipes]|uniref:Uncharacterized protein n=1 Tax=Trichonephila clavipes TaxID=2585209 RepID=A0A8X6SG23_TRICX|nr:hypothetical protein TNCV_364341 [Trichonephila clavipes]
MIYNEKWVYYNNTSCKDGWLAPGESADDWLDTLHAGVGFDSTYSPDMVPSDYLFSHLKQHLDSPIFHSNDEVINEVDCFLDSLMP